MLRTFSVLWIGLKYGPRWLFGGSRRPSLMRQAFEELGPTYIKLGQIIASSPGLFPASYVSEFQKCLDAVPEFPFVQVKSIVEAELGCPIEDVFQSLDEKPIAAASIAQVHGARLKDGTDVVIKVQRPHIAERVDADLWFMGVQARIGEFFSQDLRLANASGVIKDFHQTIHEELDFNVEGRNMDEFNAIMVEHKIDDRVCAPKVYWDQTSRRLLTMERFYGYKADDMDKAKELGLDTEQWLRTGMRAWNLTMMLHGFFHGDVHAGNLMFLPDRGQLGFIDFGIVGRFNLEQRMQVLRYVLSFSVQDYRELATVMVEMGGFEDSGQLDMDAVVADMERVYSPLLERSLAQLEYGKILPDIMANSRKHGIRMPREFILILKQLLYFDRYATLAAPNLNVFNDAFLVDFLFTPAATKSGLNLSDIGKLLIAVQRAGMAQRDAAAKANAKAETATS